MGSENDNETEQLYPYQSYEDQLFSEPSILEQQNMYGNAGYYNPNGYGNPGINGYNNPGINGYSNPGINGYNNPVSGGYGTPGAGINNGYNNFVTGQNNGNIKANKKKSKGKIALIVIIAVLMVAGIVGGTCIYLYNRPEKKVSRFLESGDELYKAGNYEAALEEYNNALKIDNECIAAIVGKINCYELLDDQEGYENFYSSSLDTISGLSSDIIEDNEENIVYIYCAAASVYADDTDTRLQVLDDGYTLTGGSEDIRTLLTEGYVEQAEICNSNSDLDGELTAYKSALSYDPECEDALRGLSIALNEEISYLIDNNCLDDAEAYIDEYENSGYDLSSVNFELYRTQLEDKKELVELIYSVMSQAMDLLASKDYDGMYDLDGTDDADTVAGTVEDYMIYTPEGDIDNNYTGTAVGMYIFEYAGYYGGYAFYYGEYENGIRTGTGTYFMRESYNGAYDVFEGQWADDMPNGEGTYTSIATEYEDGTMDKVITGNYTDGYQDGTMTGILTYEDNTYTGTWTAEAGNAPDVSASYPDLDFTSTPDSYIIYAVYLPDGDSDYYFWSYKSSDDKLGLFAEFK